MAALSARGCDASEVGIWSCPLNQSWIVFVVWKVWNDHDDFSWEQAKIEEKW